MGAEPGRRLLGVASSSSWSSRPAVGRRRWSRGWAVGGVVVAHPEHRRGDDDDGDQRGACDDPPLARRAPRHGVGCWAGRGVARVGRKSLRRWVTRWRLLPAGSGCRRGPRRPGRPVRRRRRRRRASGGKAAAAEVGQAGDGAPVVASRRPAWSLRRRRRTGDWAARQSASRRSRRRGGHGDRLYSSVKVSLVIGGPVGPGRLRCVRSARTPRRRASRIRNIMSKIHQVGWCDQSRSPAGGAGATTGAAGGGSGARAHGAGVDGGDAGRYATANGCVVVENVSRDRWGRRG